MASASKHNGFEARSESAILDPVLSSWMSRDSSVRKDKDSETSSSEEEEARKKEKDADTEIRELFRIFDKNRDNTISCTELGKMLRCVGMEVTEAEVATIMTELDKNGNGKIEYREFKAFMQEEMKRKEESPMEQQRAITMAFKVFDQNGDGVVDAKELRAAMKNLGEPLSDKELSDMMNEADVDKDGKINYEEFIKIWLASSKE